jgi:hypothetical protein
MRSWRCQDLRPRQHPRQAHPGRPESSPADTTWEAQLDFSTAGGGAWDLPLAESKQAALLLASASSKPSIPMVLLRRDAAASWRVIVREPCDGWGLRKWLQAPVALVDREGKGLHPQYAVYGLLSPELARSAAQLMLALRI